MGAQSALLHFLALSFFVWSHAAEDKTRDLSVEEDRELERELKTLNKPFVKSFQDKYGITYDCVDIYKQPAFDHPLLKNHTLQVSYHLVPTFDVYLLCFVLLRGTLLLFLLHESTSGIHYSCFSRLFDDLVSIKYVFLEIYISIDNLCFL
ncbi:hypothetical protein BHM03_00054383 [Ensete ventricosum]|nr:hypothetical protein BHM03_00054383 [Ensete ventricosum]